MFLLKSLAPRLLLFYVVAVYGQSFSGDITFYEPGGGAGACGQAISSNGLSCALNPQQLADIGCGKCLEVTGPKGKVVVTILDSCAGCKSGDVDLSTEAFNRIQDQGGRFQSSSRVVPCGDGNTPFTGTEFKPGAGGGSPLGKGNDTAANSNATSSLSSIESSSMPPVSSSLSNSPSATPASPVGFTDSEAPSETPETSQTSAAPVVPSANDQEKCAANPDVAPAWNQDLFAFPGYDAYADASASVQASANADAFESTSSSSEASADADAFADSDSNNLDEFGNEDPFAAQESDPPYQAQESDPSYQENSESIAEALAGAFATAESSEDSLKEASARSTTGYDPRRRLAKSSGQARNITIAVEVGNSDRNLTGVQPESKTCKCRLVRRKKYANILQPLT